VRTMTRSYTRSFTLNQSLPQCLPRAVRGPQGYIPAIRPRRRAADCQGQSFRRPYAACWLYLPLGEFLDSGELDI
jgi:hypothetical protein